MIIVKNLMKVFLVLDNVSNDYGNFLLIYLTNELNSIKLTRRYFDD